jgi:hypothetical protein
MQHSEALIQPSCPCICALAVGYGDYSLATEVNQSSFRIPTPNIERLAENGVRFSRGYSMQVCAPSRYLTLLSVTKLAQFSIMQLTCCTVVGHSPTQQPLSPTDVNMHTSKQLLRSSYAHSHSHFLPMLITCSAYVHSVCRCTLMTGRHLGHCTIRGNDGAYTPLLPTDSSIARVMKKAGYRTGVVGKWGLGNFNTSGYPLAQGFDYYVGQDTQVGCECCNA